MNDDLQKACWFALLSAEAVGQRTLFRFHETLKKHDMTIHDFWVGGMRIWRSMLFNERLIESIKNVEYESFIYSKYNDLKKNSISVVLYGTNEYPPLLANIEDPPFLLFVQSPIPRSEWWDKRSLSVGVVGSRNCTSYGNEATDMIVSQLVDLDVHIVSGAMYGIDERAHRACMDRGGRTIGVLGFGHNQWYPRQNTALRQTMLEQGAVLVSEYTPDSAPNKGRFVGRNRIISGLSRGVLVIEAAEKSGSLLTVQFALDQGREVFAVPGPITSPYSEGTRYLLNQGATLVSRGIDIVEHLEDWTPRSASSTLVASVIDALQSGRQHSEALMQLLMVKYKIMVSSAELIRTLTELELNGSIMRSGSLYEISHR